MTSTVFLFQIIAFLDKLKSVQGGGKSVRRSLVKGNSKRIEILEH